MNIPVNKKNLTIQIYESIKNEIISGEFQPGEQVVTNEIAKYNNISLMPVRDALNKLTDDGLLYKKSRVGYFVRKFSKEEVENIMEVRKMYEVYSLEEYFSFINKSKLKRLLESMEAQEKNLSENIFDELDYELHKHIVTASKNSYLIENYYGMSDVIELFRKLDKFRIEKAHKEHINIIKKILNEQKKEAKLLLIKHLDGVKDSILKEYNYWKD